ncbi:ATP-binding protein [Alteromonas facilis]|uniref:ATP-binding protein n=1 Tax=Alteromonas facilis TaxID=2048004 RepID=UPI000C28DF4B|nr:ATP-binding protein [Alteromonas facilis]
MKDQISLKRFLLLRSLPGQVGILLLLAIALGILFYFYSRPQIELQHLERIEKSRAGVEAAITDTTEQLINLASNDFVVNSLVEPQQQRYYLPLFFQSLQINSDANASIAFFNFNGEVIASKNIQTLDNQISTYSWSSQVLEHGKRFIEIDVRGVFIAVPVFFSAGLVEGAIVFYSPSLANMFSLTGDTSKQLIADSEGRVLIAPGDFPIKYGETLNLALIDDFIVKHREFNQLNYYSFENLIGAYSSFLYLAPFVLLTLLLALFASVSNAMHTAKIGSQTLKSFGDQIASGFRTVKINEAHTAATGIQELYKIEQSFEKLKTQIDNLSLSNDKVNNVINAMLEFVVVVDNDGKFILLNDACDKFMQNSDVMGHDLLALIDELNIGEDETHVNSTERRYFSSIGHSTKVIRWYVCPLKDNQEQVTGTVLVGEDLTLRKNLETELLLKTQAVDRASTSILISDITQPNEPIIYVNKACETLTGYKSESFIGKNCRFLQGPDTNPEHTMAIRKAIEKREPIEVTLLNYRKDGSQFYNHLTLTPIKNDDGSATHYLGIQQDVTAQEKTKEFLQTAKRKAEESSRMKADFLANMSHEIRTPINGIYGLLQLLNDSSLNTKQHEFVGLALNSTKNLLHIINDILDLSKIEAGKLAIENIFFDPSDFISEIIDSYRVQCKSKGLKFIEKVQLSDDILIKSDPTRIRQVIENVMSNAVKFTEKGSVKLIFKVTSEDTNGVLSVIVKDTGVGISPDKLNAIFEQFSQEDVSTTRKFGGTGLGLSISRQLCHLMGGDIKVASEHGQGTQFTIKLPVDIISDRDKSLDSEGAIEEDRVYESKRSLSILLVEDNEINQAVAVHQLEGHDVTVADNGQVALDILQQDDTFFDVILMDCQMPIMDGFEASKKIRSGDVGEKVKNIPIIALTANAMKGDREHCIAVGMNDYISKPFEASELARKIRYWS